ncbi:MAG: aspartyl/asparaginyl beta-hydroxylase domain-containing protein, partial [Candidatus Eremiobacteraeota bacterium]|nr:aspartyl/asparaginyl beta-hydroxylase domain-containing protein [Candidatus Eremiobacteraeota bacterium]
SSLRTHSPVSRIKSIPNSLNNAPIDEFVQKLEQHGNGWTPSWQVDSSKPNHDWLTYVLTYAGRFFSEAAVKYPVTRSLLDSDEVRVAGFSLLKPLSVIAPHRHEELGGGILTQHFGIDLSPRTNFINVQGVFQEERLGESIVFDGSFEHFAFNASLTNRVLLYIEFDSLKACV